MYIYIIYVYIYIYNKDIQYIKKCLMVTQSENQVLLARK